MDADQREIVKAGAETLFKPFADLIDKLFGGAAEQIGGMLTDSLTARRRIRQIALLGKLRVAINEAGFEPQRIPDSIWVPVLEAASLQDDETLQERWANLLANAADPEHRTSVLPSFSPILSELTSPQARLLSVLYQETAARVAKYSSGAFTRDQLLSLYVKAGLSRQPRLSNLTYGEIIRGGDALRIELDECELSLYVFAKTGLVEQVVTSDPIDLSPIADALQSDHMPRKLKTKTSTLFRLTILGKKFVKACERPAARAKTVSQSTSS